MGDSQFIIDHMGGFDSKTGEPNFMSEPSSSAQIDRSEDPTETLKKPARKLHPLEIKEFRSRWIKFQHGEGLITQEEFEKITKQLDEGLFTQDDFAKIYNRLHDKL